MKIIDSVLDAEEDENGDPIVQDKERVQLAKWICERAVVTQTAAINEEKARHNIKKDIAEEEEPEKEDVVPEVPVKRFSLHMLPTDKKD
ncbi:MAG: hypothetical protein [Myoviridae sp. ctThM1]|nr:MAG: hypothetical protein [Myoviridae sp. ctThM1]